MEMAREAPQPEPSYEQGFFPLVLPMHSFDEEKHWELRYI